MKKCEKCNNLYTCKMAQGRFNVKLCSKNYKNKMEKKHNKELKERKLILIGIIRKN